MSIVQQRAAAVAATAERIRAVGLSPNPAANTPDRIAAAGAALAELAARAELFPAGHFPLKHGGVSGFYRLIEDPDFRNALYISVSPSKFFNSRPHAHAHWVLIAGVAGTEHNVLYERDDDGSVEGRGRLRKIREVPVRKGDVLFVPRPEYHTVAYDGTEPAINLHFYGLGLDSAEGLRAPSFPSADADHYETDSRPHTYWGVPRIGAAEIVAARRGPLTVAIVGPGEIGNIDAIGIADPANPPALPAGPDPVLLIGEAGSVEIAAERLARQGRRTFVGASFEDARKALAQG